MSKALENLEELNKKIDLLVKRNEHLENENKRISEARIKQANYIADLLHFVYMHIKPNVNYSAWFKKFDKEMEFYYEARNNKCAADNPDCNSLHPGDVVLQSGGTAAGTDKVHECRA